MSPTSTITFANLQGRAGRIARRTGAASAASAVLTGLALGLPSPAGGASTLDMAQYPTSRRTMAAGCDMGELTKLPKSLVDALKAEAPSNGNLRADLMLPMGAAHTIQTSGSDRRMGTAYQSVKVDGQSWAEAVSDTDSRIPGYYHDTARFSVGSERYDDFQIDKPNRPAILAMDILAPGNFNHSARVLRDPSGTTTWVACLPLELGQKGAPFRIFKEGELYASASPSQLKDGVTEYRLLRSSDGKELLRLRSPHYVAPPVPDYNLGLPPDSYYAQLYSQSNMQIQVAEKTDPVIPLLLLNIFSPTEKMSPARAQEQVQEAALRGANELHAYASAQALHQLLSKPGQIDFGEVCDFFPNLDGYSLQRQIYQEQYGEDPTQLIPARLDELGKAQLQGWVSGGPSELAQTIAQLQSTPVGSKVVAAAESKGVKVWVLPVDAYGHRFPGSVGVTFGKNIFIPTGNVSGGKLNGDVVIHEMIHAVLGDALGLDRPQAERIALTRREISKLGIPPEVGEWIVEATVNWPKDSAAHQHVATRFFEREYEHEVLSPSTKESSARTKAAVEAIARRELAIHLLERSNFHDPKDAKKVADLEDYAKAMLSEFRVTPQAQALRGIDLHSLSEVIKILKSWFPDESIPAYGSAAS